MILRSYPEYETGMSDDLPMQLPSCHSQTALSTLKIAPVRTDREKYVKKKLIVPNSTASQEAVPTMEV